MLPASRLMYLLCNVLLSGGVGHPHTTSVAVCSPRFPFPAVSFFKVSAGQMWAVSYCEGATGNVLHIGVINSLTRMLWRWYSLSAAARVS